jgi:hypothetical protein
MILFYFSLPTLLKFDVSGVGESLAFESADVHVPFNLNYRESGELSVKRSRFLKNVFFIVFDIHSVLRRFVARGSVACGSVAFRNPMIRRPRIRRPPQSVAG